MATKARTLRTRICDEIGIEYPIFLAGMGQLVGSNAGEGARLSANPKLVAAVSEAGGLGVLGATGVFPDALREQLREVKALTSKPFGVDLLLPHAKLELPEGTSVEEVIEKFIPPEHRAMVERMRDELDIPEPTGESFLANFAGTLTETTARRQIEVCLEEGSAVVASALGMPEWLPPMCREAGAKVLGLAGSLRAAQRHAELGADIIVAQGYEAGGHTGRVGGMALIPRIVDEVAPIPVLAAGGIADGRGVAAALALGASGVWVGTYFLFAAEAGEAPLLRRVMERSTEEDVVISRAVSGKTARVFRNAVTEYWERCGLPPLQMPLQSWLMVDVMQGCIESEREDLVVGAGGQSIGRLRETRPAAELFADLVEGAEETIRGLCGVLEEDTAR